ncbi:MAG: hypothetical protein GXP43_00450 [bacterium]|nr:hypothetical protein [bacterium]
MSPKRRSIEIRQKKKRRAKLQKLRQRYLSEKQSKERDEIWAKVTKIAPWLSLKEFLAKK